MSNLYSEFLSLIPQQPTQVAKVISISQETHTLELVGGNNLVEIKSQKPYPKDSLVFIRGDMILSEAPNNPVVTIEI